jgi:hypothetical protein
VGGNVLRDLRRVDVDVDELRPRRELGELAGDAVIEAGADGDDQVGGVHRVVGGAGAVHAEHPEPLLVRRRKGPEAHHRQRHRQLVGGDELDQLLRGIGVDDAAAGVDDRPPGIGERLRRDPDLLDVALGRRFVAGQLRRSLGRLVVDVDPGEVLGDVDEHRAGTAGGGDVEGLVDVLGDLARVLHQERVLDDRQRHPGDVGLLEAVGADQVGADLPGDEDGRNRIHHRVGDRRDQVGRARARSRKRDADPAGGLCVALRHVAAALLVAGLDVLELGVVERVVGRQVGAAGDSEDVLDALGLQRFTQCIRRPHGASDGSAA